MPKVVRKNHCELAQEVERNMAAVMNYAGEKNYPMAYGNLMAWFIDALDLMPPSKQKTFLAEMARINAAIGRDRAAMNEAANRQRPAYYDAEGGSMCNGIGRDYF